MVYAKQCLTPDDAGVYYCAWAVSGQDVYQEVPFTVLDPTPALRVQEAVDKLHTDSSEWPEAAAKDLEFIMGSDLTLKSELPRLSVKLCMCSCVITERNYYGRHRRRVL